MILVAKNSDLKTLNPVDGETYMLPNYRVEVVKNEKDNSLSKSRIYDRKTYKQLSYFFSNVPTFIMTFLNKTAPPDKNLMG